MERFAETKILKTRCKSRKSINFSKKCVNFYISNYDFALKEIKMSVKMNILPSKKNTS